MPTKRRLIRANTSCGPAHSLEVNPCGFSFEVEPVFQNPLPCKYEGMRWFNDSQKIDVVSAVCAGVERLMVARVGLELGS